MNKNFHSSPRSGFLVLLFILPATLLLIWLGTNIAMQQEYLVSAIFAAVAMLLLIFLVFQLTLRVCIDDRSITRSWLLGHTVIPMGEISRLTWGGGRGVLILTISYGRGRFIQLSTSALTEPELRDIQKEIIAARGLEGKPLLPPFAEQVGYIDIAEMSSKQH